MRWYWYAGIGAALLVGGFALGRYTRPQPVISATNTTKAADAKKTQTNTVAVAKERTRTKIVRRTVRIRRPDGTEQRTTDVAIDTGTTRDEETTTKETREEARVVEVTKEVIVRVPQPAPRWMLGGYAAMDTAAKLSYGPALGYRLAGPVWLTATAVLPAKAATIGLAVTW